jgi:hypothetical protein
MTGSQRRGDPRGRRLTQVTLSSISHAWSRTCHAARRTK